ncbi:MAG: helix-turn-helix domain-containing protein [Christensenellales bacterium]
MDIRTERLREAFEKSGLTQSEVCSRTGINKGAFSSYLSIRF